MTLAEWFARLGFDEDLIREAAEYAEEVREETRRRLAEEAWGEHDD